MRGLNPQDVQNLLSGAMNLRQLTGAEIAKQEAAQIAKSKAATAQTKAEAEAGKITYSRPYVRNGRSVRDKIVGGSVVSQEDLGEPKGTEFKPTLLEMPDGNLKEVPVGSPIPEGAKLPTKRTEELTPGQQLGLETELAKIESWFVGAEGEDAEILKGYVDLYNSRSKDKEAVFIPEDVGNRLNPLDNKPARVEVRPKGGESPAPTPPAPTAEQASDVQYTEASPANPTTQAEFDALPIGAVYIDPDNGNLYRK